MNADQPPPAPDRDGLATLEAALRAIAAPRMGTDPAHDIQHVQRVVAAAKTIAAVEDEPLSLPSLLAAAWLHDIVAVEKDSGARAQAGRRAADLASALLREHGLAGDVDLEDLDLDIVHDAIACHNYSAGLTPRTCEGLVLQDADRLDAIGAIGIARCFAVGARIGAAFHHPQEPVPVSRALDDRRYALDHFHAKLPHLADGMHTATARRLARERTAVMKAFLDRFAREIAGLA